MSYTADEMMTVAAARALADGVVCFVGIGLPSTAANLARRTHAPNLVLVYESGTLSAKPGFLPLYIGDGVLADTADSVIVSLAEVDERLGLPNVSSREREQEADDSTCHESDDGEPPARLQAFPGRGEIDLLLALEVGYGLGGGHRAATLSAAQRHWAPSPSANGVCGSQPSSAWIRDVSAAVRATSPSTRGARTTSRRRPAIRPRISIAWSIDTSTPPPTL